MNIEFYDAHLQTLKELQELAEKHNCKIHFGCRSNFSTDNLEASDLDVVGVPDDIINTLIDWESNISVNNVKSTYEDFWFELYDPNNQDRHYHTMTYKDISLYFEVEMDYDFDKDENEKFVEWCDEHQVDWAETENGWTFNLSSAPTVIYGFGYDEEHRDYRVYRDGMALKYFSDLVCDYLKEPRIERTY